MLRKLSTLAVTLLLAGCMTTSAELGLIRPSGESAGLKMIRPGARVRACRSSLFGIPLQSPATTSLLPDLLKVDAEADVVAKARVTTESITTGIYNRTCVELVGDLGREVSVVRLPAVGGGHEHHH
jgi:hypothetical protein